MAKRVDYQNPLDNLEEIYEKRNAQIRAWAKADQERADALIGVPTDITTFDDWDVLEPDTGKVDPSGGEWQLTEEPKEEEEEEEQPDAVPASAESIASVTETEDPDPTPAPQDPVKEEVKEEPKKTPAKKAAAAPKEASSKA